MKAVACFRAGLSLSLVLGLPPISAYEAAAQLQSLRVPAANAASLRIGWANASSRLVNRLLLEPGAAVGMPGLIGVLGQARIELTLDNDAQEALAYVRHLPAAVAADPDAFSALPLEEQARLAEAASGAARVELELRVAPLLARAAAGEPAPGDAKLLRSLKSGWFYLEADSGQGLRRLAAAARTRRGFAFARDLAARLSGKSRSEPSAEPAPDAITMEWAHLFGGARQALAAGPRDGAVRDRLVPYAERALDAAAERIKARGHDVSAFLSAPYVQHNQTFGHLAHPALVEELRASGEWTDLVAALLMRAARGLSAAGSLHAEPLLADLARYRMFRLPIPAWKPEAAAHATVADWLGAEHAGAPRREPVPGKRVFSLGGMPVYVTRDFLPVAAALFAVLSLNIFAALTPQLGALAHLAQGAAAVLGVYGSLFVHELGHAWLARRYGFEVRAIVLRGAGAGAHIRDEPVRPLHNALQALIGPAVNVLFAGLFYGLALVTRADPVVSAPALAVAFLNAVTAAENLLPMLPGDGGRALRAMLAAYYGDYYPATRAGRKISVYVSWAVAAGGIALALLGHPMLGTVTAAVALFRLPMALKSAFHPGTQLK